MILKTDFNIFFYKNFVENMQTPSLGWQYKKKIPPPQKKQSYWLLKTYIRYNVCMNANHHQS